MKINTRITGSGVAFVWLLLVSQLVGQLPNARLLRIFPCGGQVGTDVEVTTSGTDLDEAAQLVFSDSRITAKVKMSVGSDISPATPIYNQFVVNIPSDVRPGIYEARTIGRFGMSTPRRFVVSNRSEIVCTDKNRTPDTALALPLNSSVNAKSIANARHFYKFTLKKDEKVSIECQAKVLSSKMDPVLVISDLSGREITRSRSSTLQNAVLLFKAPIASQYILTVRDAVFGGGVDHFYRVNLSNRPYIAAVEPTVIQRGKNPTLKLFGWNLPGGQEESNFEMIQKPAAELVSSGENTEAFPIYTQSTTLNWQCVSLQEGGQTVSNQIPIILSDLNVHLEDQDLPSNKIDAPVEISGRFSPNNEIDIYEFTASGGETFYIDAYSHRLGKNTDLILTLQQQIKAGDGTISWKKISVVDDPGNRAAGIGPNFTTSTDDPGLRFQAPAQGIYRILIKDQFGTYDQDVRSTYRISIRHPQPDYRVVCNPVYGRAANANQILANALVVRKGGRTHLTTSVERLDGFTGPITISCEDLPAGVQCPPVSVAANQSSVDLVFTAAENAAPENSIIKVVGKAKIADQEVSHNAFYSCVTWETGNKGQIPAYYRRIPDLELSVLPHETAAASVQIGNGTPLKTSIGGKIKIPVKLTRRHKFADPLKLVARNLPGQLKPADLTIAKDKTDASLELFVKDKNTPLGVYSFCLKGDAKFKYSRNPEAVTQAEAEHKRLDELFKSTTAAKTKLTADIAAASKSLPALDQAIAAAKVNFDKAQKEAAAVAAEIKSLETAIEKSKAEKVDPIVVKAATANLAQRKATAAADQTLKNSEQARKSTEQKKADTMSLIASGKKKLTETDAKLKQIDAARKAAKAKVDNLKKQSAPKDLFYMTVSNPLQIEVVASPITIEPLAAQTGTVESTLNPVLKISRQFGFADAVNLTFKLPTGVVIKPISIAKDKSETPLPLQIQKNCPIGTHKIEVTAAGKFNNVDVKTTSTFNLQVSAKPQAAEAKK